MFKYKNNSKCNLILEVNGRVQTIKPNQEIFSKILLDNKFLIEISEKPLVSKDFKKQFKSSKDEVKLNDSQA